MRLHPVDDGASELVGVRDFRVAIHDTRHGNRENVLFVLHQSRQVTSCNHAAHHALVVGDDRDTAPLRQLHYRLAHRRCLCEDRQFVRHHHICHTCHQSLANRTARMQPREIVGVEALLFQQRDRECIAERQGNSGARRWRKIVRTRFFLHPTVKCNVAVPRQRRLRIAG